MMTTPKETSSTQSLQICTTVGHHPHILRSFNLASILTQSQPASCLQGLCKAPLALLLAFTSLTTAHRDLAELAQPTWHSQSSLESSFGRLSCNLLNPLLYSRSPRPFVATPMQQIHKPGEHGTGSSAEKSVTPKPQVKRFIRQQVRIQNSSGCTLSILVLRDMI